MAEKTEFLQAIDDAILDADSLEQFINGSDSETVLTRLSKRYPTLQKAIKQMFENGGLPATPFTTKALMEASDLSDDSYAMVTDDATSIDNGLYFKSGGNWVKSEYDTASVSFVNENLFFKPSVKTRTNYDLDDFKTGGLYLFNEAPKDPEVAKNFPAYGSGNSGALFVMAAVGEDTNIVVRQVYVSRNAMYFRSQFGGVMESWRKLANDADLQELKNSSLVLNTYDKLDYDLNDFITSGVYTFIYSVDNPEVSKNFPEYGKGASAGTLIVMSGTADAEDNLVRQIYISRTKLFYRATYRGVFEPWIAAANEEQVIDIVKQNSMAKPTVVDIPNGIDLNVYTESGMHIFTVAPRDPEVAKNFPAYGTGSAGSLIVLGSPSPTSVNKIVRQIFITSNAMYFRATYMGEFAEWQSTSSLGGIPTSEKHVTLDKNWVYRDGNYLKQTRGEYPDYYTKPNSEVIPSVADWYARYDSLMDAHPDIITKTKIGESAGGFDMFAYTISPPLKHLTGLWTDKKPPKIIIQTLIHGIEHIGSIALFGFLDNLLNNFRTEDGYAVLRNTFEFVVVPIANPDGVEGRKRANANGVDLNRDWIDQTQPETIHLRDFYEQHLDAIHFIDMHAHGERFLFWLGTNDNFDFAEAYSNELVADVLKRFLPDKDPHLDYSWITPSINPGTCLNYFTNKNMNAMLIENLNGTSHRFGDGTILTMRKIGIYSLYKAVEYILKAHTNSKLKLAI